MAFYGRMASCVGRNLFACSERYDVSVNGIVHDFFNGHSVKSLCERLTPLDYYSSALATLELLMIRHGLLHCVREKREASSFSTISLAFLNRFS